MTASGRPIVRVVDDDPSFLRAVARRLEAAGFAVASFSSPQAFFARRLDAPGCVVLDLQMPTQDGLEVQAALQQTDNPLPVVFLTGHGDVHTSVRAMKHGAVDFLTKPVVGDELVQSVERAIARDALDRAQRRALQDLRVRYDRLTARERQVLVLVAAGLLNKQIAAELGTSERTVKAHRAHIMRKMHVGSVAELVRAADRLTSNHERLRRPDLER